MTFGIPWESFEDTNTTEVVPDESIKSTKRFKLIEFASNSLRQAIWSEEVYTEINQYLGKVKELSDTDEYFKQSLIYKEFLANLDNCIELLRDLKKDPENCEKQKALQSSYNRMRFLLMADFRDNFLYEYTERYMDFVLEMHRIRRTSLQKFYAKLKKAVESYIEDLGENEKHLEADIIGWHKKFTKETDFILKEILSMMFMELLFPDERASLETKCKIQFSNVV